jgi:ATP phosphoribosyltransferase
MALTLAIPSKGRLQEQASEWFADAGLALKQTTGARGYRATLKGLPDIDVRLLSASEIASGLVTGDVHMGITGEDLIRETAPELSSSVVLIHALGFGYANVVVAVPQAWIDVSTMADLDDVCAAFAHRHRRRLRIATKYTHLTRAFFAHAGISDYRIVESAGATEGAPTAGSAEAIVDITTTGATLAANGLKTLEDGTILESQAQLAAGVAADWSADARDAARALLMRLGARERAKASHVLRVQLDAAAAEALGLEILTRPVGGTGEHTLLCPRDRLMDVTASLRAKGAGVATAEEVEYIFRDSEPLAEKLFSALPA